MQLGRVIGTVVASKKIKSLDSVKLNVVQPLNDDLKPYGEPVIAADAITQAGRGELIFYVTSRDATEAFKDPFIPVDASIVAIVDRIDKS
ncbi:MAG: EutN/CcmL family microcompartment protein [Spirochaetes bacterium]|nr:EutN/CcmL family microcompartment protein [Spirochaetota bacterium]